MCVPDFRLPCWEAKPARKALRDAKQLERELISRVSAGVPCEPFLPAEAVVRPLAECEHSRRCGR